LLKRISIFVIILFSISVQQIIAQQNGVFYWIGGTGNWSDTLNWFSDSGGLPGPGDHVIFDENSFSEKFQQVTIDIEAHCRNMNWTASQMEPILNGNKKLNINGAFKLAPGMTVNYSGSIHFLADSGNYQLLLNGNTLKSDLYFNGEGSWELLDELNTGLNKIFFNKGVLLFSNQVVTCGSFNSATNLQRTLFMNGSVISIMLANGTWNVNSQLNIQMQGNSIIRFTEAGPSAINTFNGGGLSYGTVVFENSAVIQGSNLYIHLHLNAAKSYVLPQGGTQTLTGQIFARGCAGMIAISSSGSEPAFIAKSNGNIQISFASLRSVHAQVAPPYQFMALNSVDDGNNNGVNFSMQSRDLYWVNGSGDWTDTTRWISLPFNEDSDCAPMPFDNVFFNEDSFPDLADTVSVNLPLVKVNNMTWSGEKDPVFYNTVSPSAMEIYGSLQFTVKMQNYYDGVIHFMDTLGGRSIKTSHRKFLNDLVFMGENGGWVIYDTLNTDGSIYFMKGDLFTQGHYISCFTFRSDSAFLRTLSLDTSVIQVKGSNAGVSWSLNNEFLEFDAGTSRIEISALDGSLVTIGEDTVQYNDIAFMRNTGIGRVKTEPDTYSVFRKVEFMSNGGISGSNTYDTLAFSPGCHYDLPPGATQTILGDIYPSGVCEGPVLLKSSTNGQQAGLFKSSDTLLIKSAALRDINAYGGAVFIAQMSVDLGNNSGWDTIAVTAPGKLFWVGGTGDWSAVSHWSTTSGGAGGECIPTPFDTVIFDQNSFSAVNQYVNIDLNNAFAGYMDWSSAGFIPEFKGNINTSWLRIYGSLKLNPDMIFTYPGFISFESSHPEETILLEGVKLHNINNSVFFDGIGGEWTLLDSLQLGQSTSNRNSLFYYNGTLNTNSQFIDCYGFYSNRPNIRNFHPGSSHFDVYQEWNIHGENLALADNNSRITLTNGNFIHRYGDFAPYYDISFYSESNNQYLLTQNVNDVLFRHVLFESPSGRIYGNNCNVIGKTAIFNGEGFVNTSNGNNVNVYVLDSLIFNSTGHIFGKDTVNHLLIFSDQGNITGNGFYAHALFLNDGIIQGNNIFDTLSFNPPFTYQLGSQNIQAISDQFNVTGNHCEYIILKSTTDNPAEVFKESGFVQGNFIEMTNISATGDAEFDAGQFSIDVGNSNDGWLFHDPSLNYKLVSDSSFQQGDTVYLCADNFGGNSTTTYEWKNCDTGEILGSDSCLAVSHKGTYCLTAFYDEGGGCEKLDTITIGCHLLLSLETTDISCYGFEDGSVQVIVEVGEEPFNIHWFNSGVLFSDSMIIENLQPGMYNYQIEDAEGCHSSGYVTIDQPEEMLLAYAALDACYEADNGSISLEITGGTEPYVFEWAHGATMSELIGLSPGTYQVTVSDLNSCPEVTQIIIIHEIQELKFALLGTDLMCFNDQSGDILITGLEGGTGIYSIYFWYKDGYFYSETMDISGLQSGYYELVITDDRGCLGNNGIFITQPDPLDLKLESLKEAIELGSIDLTVTGGTPPYMYLWNTGALTEDIDPLGGGLYTVDVTDHNLCKATESIFVEVHYRVFAPTAFSPNGDGVNDTFSLFGMGTDLKDFHLTIFNRFGQVVYESKNVNEGWNGRLMNSGAPLPSEVYTWQTHITYVGGESIVDSGNITLLR